MWVVAVVHRIACDLRRMCTVNSNDKNANLTKIKSCFSLDERKRQTKEHPMAL